MLYVAKKEGYLIMKIIIFVMIFMVVFLNYGLCSEVNASRTPEEENMNYGINITTDRGSYATGEPVKIIMKIFNYSEENIVFHFNTSQRYDFIIEDEKGEEIWRWSEDKMFVMVLGGETLGPAHPELIYSAEYAGKVEPGCYKITAVFTASDKPISGNLFIQVN
jgi:hypothetical protein